MGGRETKETATDRAKRIREAERLVRLGFRTKVIVHHTRLSQKIVREIYRQVSGRSPRSGRLPQCDGVCKTRKHLCEASIVISLYQAISARDVTREVDMDALVEAIRFYRSRVERPLLEPSHVWVLARDLRSGRGGADSALVRLVRCATCGADYLVVSQQRFRQQCPFCRCP